VRAPWPAMRGCARLFEAARRRVLCDAVKRDRLRADVSEMRLRMRRELSKAGPGQFDIKQGAGGIADIEFLVQYWVLSAAQAHPQLLTYTDNVRQLEGLAAVGFLQHETAQWLMDAYVSYRTVLHHLSLEGAASAWSMPRPTLPPAIACREIWRETFG
jgi:glutamate-ammonia-ligase adenylyltransferase